MTLNLIPTVAPETTFSASPVAEQIAVAMDTARDFCCYPERALGSNPDGWDREIVGRIATGFLDWYGDEIAGYDIAGPIHNAIVIASRRAYDRFGTNRDSVAIVMASTAVALLPPTQR